jgi:uncharacterized membrane-anchored protein YhcB (DUF1043 family)
MFTLTDILFGAIYAVVAFVVSVVLGYYISRLLFPSPENIEILMYEHDILNTPHHRKRR